MEQATQRTRNDTVKELCMECAMRRHTFNESTGRGRRIDHFDQVSLPEALIDGRCHMLLPHAWSHQDTCSECNQTTPTLYVPMK